MIFYVDDFSLFTAIVERLNPLFVSELQLETLALYYDPNVNECLGAFGEIIHQYVN